VAEGERAVFVGQGGRRLAKRSIDDVVRGVGEVPA
jgi:site-specific recombinase XerC